MASVKVIVTALSRYWCAGRCWEAGVTEAVLEDMPGLTIDQQLAQLAAAKGGQRLEMSGLDRGMSDAPRSPGVLTYRIVAEPAPEPAPEPVVEPPPAADGSPSMTADAPGTAATSQTEPPSPGATTETSP